MKTKILLSTALFIMLHLLFIKTTSANSTESEPNHLEEDFFLTLTTEVTETYCGGCVGAIDLTVSGGQAPYTYAWANGAITEDLDNLCIGVYVVTVTDATGCTGVTNPFLGENNYPNVELESQAEVDEYVANYSFCGEVPGILRIGTTFSDPPSNITDISGLSFITKVGSNLFIFQNPNLTSLNGLQNITSIGNSVNITNNNNLTDLNNFPAINAISGNLTIDNCSNLVSLNGLNQINAIDGDVYLAAAQDLTSLAALSNLQVVNGDLDIRICTSLSNFNGLENLNTINGDLVLRDNIILNDIAALDHPIAISGDLEIQNTNLSACSIQPICEMLEAGANAIISNNSNACNSVDEVLANCSAVELSTIDFEGVLPLCPDACNGRIIANVTGGSPPLTYTWSTGAVSSFPTLPGLCSGSYSVTINDVNGMSVMDTFELGGIDAIQVDWLILNEACVETCGFEVEINIEGGTPPYVYNGLPDEICLNTPYFFEVADSNACGGTYELLIPSTGPLTFTLDETGDDINEQSNGYFNGTTTGGIGPFAYEWFLDGVLVSTEENPTGLSMGTYTLSINDNGCIYEYGPFMINGIVGIKDLVEESVRIFPIPAETSFQVVIDTPVAEEISYTLWNAAGSLMQAGIFSNHTEIPVETLSQGIYFIKLEMNNTVLVRKVFKN